MEQSVRPRHMQGRQLLKTVLFVGGSVLAAAVFLFTHQSVSRLEHEVSTTSQLLAEFSAQASIPASRDPQLQHIFAELIQNIDFPIIITDTLGTPRAWHGIGMAPSLIPTEALDSLSMRLAVSAVTAGRVNRIRARAAELDRSHKPIPMREPRTKQLIGQLHHGEPALMNRLRWMPFLTVAGVGLLLLLGLRDNSISGL